MSGNNQADLTEVHPFFTEFAKDWSQMEDTYRGQRRIKDQGIIYLPPTSGQVADGATAENVTGVNDSDGQKAYDAYKDRAVYHNFVKRAVKAALGIMHSKPPKIELPAKLKYMLEKATTNGESLSMLLRRINLRQLIQGRLGILLDLPVKDGGAEDLYLALYTAMSITNWDDGEEEELTLGQLNMVILDESSFERQDTFQWDIIRKYRVLILGDIEPNEGQTSGVKYRAGLFTQEGDNITFSEDKLREPGIRGQTLEEIPFVFINSKDLVTTPEEPPLLDLSNLALTVYRGEADYRQNLFMQGQDTLVIIGAGSSKKGEKERVGAGAKLNVQQGGDAKYIGVNSKGLPEQKDALQNDKQEAAQMGGQLLDTSSRSKEAQGSLEIRVHGQTATLNEIALAGAGGLEKILKIAAKWVGANPDEVVVTPNLDFVNEKMDATMLKLYMESYILGAPISLETIHNLMVKKDVTQFSFEEETDKKENDNLIAISSSESDEDIT